MKEKKKNKNNKEKKYKKIYNDPIDVQYLRCAHIPFDISQRINVQYG